MKTVIKMKICMKDTKSTLIFGISSVLSLLLIIGLVYESYNNYVYNYLNPELLISGLLLIPLIYLLFYSILLIQCNNYSIEFKEYHLIYKVLFPYEVQYTKINGVIMLVLPTRGGAELNILKIKFKNRRPIRLRIDKLKNSEKEDLINAFEQITGKEIEKKVRFLFW